MEKLVNFEVDELEKIDFDNYSNEEFAIARMGFLSTKPNSHELKISEEVLRDCAKTVLDKWVVADMQFGEPTTHTKNEHIVGKIPKDQSIEFVYDGNGYLRAYVDTVISKIYAKDFCEAFAVDTSRAVSVEMKVEVSESDENEVISFNIVGVTVLGKTVLPSCPDSDINMIRFSQEDADTYFSKIHEHNFTLLQEFAEERKILMAKSLKIDKSKDSLSDKSWGEVDKTELRNKIMEASNRATLVKAVYMLVEDGWEEAPSEHLKYPVMCFEGDTLVYNREGLSTALGYARKENETSVVNKIEEIYENLGLEEAGKEGESKMVEIEFSAVDIGNMWSRLWDRLHEKHPDHDGYGSLYIIEGIYEEDNQKFAIIRHKDEDALYRLDFSLTEEGLTIADTIAKVELDIVETDDVRKFAEPENVEQYRKFAEKQEEEEDEDEEEEREDDEDKEEQEAKMSAEDMLKRIAELETAIEERDNIIMEQNNELEELRQFKNGYMEAQRASKVEEVMSSVANFMDKETIKSFREEGLKCEFAEVDAWANKVKSSVFDKVTKKGVDNNEFTRMSAPINPVQKPNSIWDRI